MSTSDVPFEAAELAIQVSRILCVQREYDSALNILKALTPEEVSSAVFLETARVHMLLGNRPAALQVLKGKELSSPHSEAQEVIQAFIAVSQEGTLFEALTIASAAWTKFSGQAGVPECTDVVYLILYYCIGIHELWQSYGEGYEDPNIKINDSIEAIASGLFQAQLYHEAFEVSEAHFESPSTIFERLMRSQQDSAVRAACGLRLAEIQGKELNPTATSETLDDIHETIADQPFNYRIWKRIRLMYIDAKTPELDRVKDLSEAADWYLERGCFDDALKTFDDAAEIHSCCQVSAKAFDLGMKLYDRLRSLCLSVEDTLSTIHYEFRRCDMIASLTSDFARARRDRDSLLEQPICQRLPFFRVQHKRQWSEYSILSQRDQALYHAKKYLEFCQQYKSEAEQSYAEYYRLQSLTRVQRMSDEARLSMLQDAQAEIESSVEIDRRKGFHLPLVKKLLLLADVWADLDDPIRDEDEEFQSVSKKWIDEAWDIAQRFEFTGEDATLRGQIYLRRFMAHDGQSGIPDAMPAISNLISKNESETEQEDLELMNPQQMPRRSFRMYEYLPNLGIAIQSGKESLLSEILRRTEDEGSRLEHEGGHSLEKATYFAFMAYTYSALLDYSEFATFDVLPLIRCSSPEICIEKCLKVINFSLEFNEIHWKETESSSKIVDMLSSRQAFGTRSDELSMFEIALKLSYRLEDKETFWNWVQRSKSRSYSSLLKDLSARDHGTTAITELHLDLKALIQLSSTNKHHVKFVDWISFDSPAKIVILVRSFEETDTGISTKLIVQECKISKPDIEKARRRLRHAILDSPDAQRFLKSLLPLVEPLHDLSEKDDVLVFSPTSLLHNLPLHAIAVGNQVLLERNPIVYTPSLEALVIMHSRSQEGKDDAEEQHSSLMCSAYDDNSEDQSIESERNLIYTDLRQLADTLDTSSILLGPEVSVEAIKAKAAASSLFHFHGHAIYDLHDIMNQMLVLGDPSATLSLTQIAELGLDRALVTLIACEGGLQDYSIGGDEPLGMLSCFFLGGATSVVAALWSIKSSTGRAFTKAFYHNLSLQRTTSSKHSVLDLAVAVQATCLELKRTPGLENPYHWAAFVLHGLWFNANLNIPLAP